MRVGIDIDDVLFDFVSVWIAEYNKEYDDHIALEDITDWVFSGVDFKCTKVEFYNYLHNAYLQLRAEMFPGAAESLDRLADMGHLACFITATRRSVAPTKINKLLMELSLDLNYELHFTREKWHVTCDVYIDDNPKDIEGYMKYCRLPHFPLVLLFDRPWNRHVETNSIGWFSEEVQARQGKDGMFKVNRMVVTKLPIRVYDWQDIIAAIDWYERLDMDPEVDTFITEIADTVRGGTMFEDVTDIMKNAEESEKCHGCVYRHECSLDHTICEGPYEETLH